MKITWRIWLLSLLIQPVMFGPLGLFVIPIEIIYSLPGILIFWLLVQVIVLKKMPVRAKWICLCIAGAITAAFCSFLVLYGNIDHGLTEDDYDWLFMLPAPAAALMAIFFSRKHIRNLFHEMNDTDEMAVHPATE